MPSPETTPAPAPKPDKPKKLRFFLDSEFNEHAAAFALDPRNPNAYNLLADTFVLQRRFPEAVPIAIRLLALARE